MVHALKIYPEYFEAVKSGKKPFEVRKNDRDFKVGDILALNEFDPLEGAEGKYTGWTLFKRISYILDDEAYCKAGFVIIGISPCMITDEDFTQEVKR